MVRHMCVAVIARSSPEWAKGLRFRAGHVGQDVRLLPCREYLPSEEGEGYVPLCEKYCRRHDLDMVSLLYSLRHIAASSCSDHGPEVSMTLYTSSTTIKVFFIFYLFIFLDATTNNLLPWHTPWRSNLSMMQATWSPTL